MQREAPARPPAVLPKPIKDALAKARVSWLKNTEVAQLLSCHRALGFEVSQEAPDRPQSGSVFLFNRKTLRFFRKDGHSWRKKPDGKTVRETHEKLKVGSRDMLNCYYAHSDQDDGLQRRCYWLLDGDDGTVLVHYLASKKLGRANSDPRCQSEPMLPHFWDTARVEDYETSPYPHKAQRCYHGGLQDTCMHFEQGPIITTAPDLDRACTSSLLPPLPSSSSSSRSRHPRAMMTIPSSSGTARQQYSSAMIGRPHAVVTDLDSFMHRGSETPVTARPSAMALLGTTDGTTPSPHASHGDFKLGFREQPIVFDHETALTRPGSALSAHDSGLTGIAPALDKGYMGRQVASGGMEPDLMDESQCDVEAVRSMLLSREGMSHAETASAPSRIVESGSQAPASLDNHAGSVTPHRRQPSNGASNQGYARSLPSGLGFADHYLAGLQQPSPQGRQSMDAAMTGLHQAALSGLHHTALSGPHQAALSGHAPLSERELRQSVLAGQGLQQAALIQQGLNQTALAGQETLNPRHSFTPITPAPTAHHDASPWDSIGPSPMMQDDAAFACHPETMTNHHLMQAAPVMPTGDMNQETLSTRSHYFARDPESARGTLQWPLPMPDSSSRHAYSPWPVQTAQPQPGPQPGLQTHSQMPAQASLDPRQQPDSLPGFRSKSLPGLAEQPGYGHRQVWAQAASAASAAAHPNYATGFGTGLQTPTQTPAPLKSFADSYASRQTQEQAEALEYLRRSSVTPRLVPSWQSAWAANTQLPDLEARMEAEQQLMGQPDNAAAFASWMQAQRFHGSDLHCTV